MIKRSIRDIIEIFTLFKALNVRDYFTALIDRYGRQLINARLVITLRCNFRCVFCHRENSQGDENELSPEELVLVSEALAKVGVRKYKITGGEPLLREDVVEIVRGLRKYGKAEEVSMTTNGFLLKERVGDLVEAGLDRVNVSLHSLKPGRFGFITGVNALEKVTSGIREAANHNMSKVKINFVALKGVNEDEIWDIVRFSESLGIHVQLIELHPVGRGRSLFNGYYMSLSKFLKELHEKASKVVIRGELHNRPIYVLPSGTTVEVVRPVLNPIFCAGCSRIRVSPDGAIVPCLNSDLRFPIANIIRSDIPRDEKVDKIVGVILKVNSVRKPHTLWPIKGEVDAEYLNIMKLGGFTKKFRLTH